MQPAPTHSKKHPQHAVLTFRWQKPLHSNMPNFQVPGMFEANDRFYPVETAGIGFDTDARRVFIGAAVGGFYCLDAFSGQTVWRYSLRTPVGSTPIYDAERLRVYFGTDDGVLYALHARSGRLLAQLETGAEIRRKIWLREDTIYFANADNTVMAVDPMTFETIWRYRRAPVEGFSAAGYSDLRFDGDSVYVGFSDGFLVSLDAATGVANWEQDLASEAVANLKPNEFKLSDIDAPPVVIRQTAIAASVAGGVFGMDAETGNILWARPDLDMVTGMGEAFEEVVVLRAGNRGMTVLNPETGETRLTSMFGMGHKSDPVLYDDVLLVTDTEAGMYAISVGTGEVLQRLDMNGGFFSRPSEYGGYLFVLGNWSTLYAFSIR